LIRSTVGVEGILTKRMAILGAIVTDLLMVKIERVVVVVSGGVTGWKQVGNNREGTVNCYIL
jgi:hypothetical protein